MFGGQEIPADFFQNFGNNKGGGKKSASRSQAKKTSSSMHFMAPMKNNFFLDIDQIQAMARLPQSRQEPAEQRPKSSNQNMSYFTSKNSTLAQQQSKATTVSRKKIKSANSSFAMYRGSGGTTS